MSSAPRINIEQGIAQRFLEISERFSGRPAILVDRMISYRQLRERVFGFASSLLENGAHPGDRIVIYHSSPLDMVAAILGTLYCGCIYVPVAPILGAAQVISTIREVEPRVISGDTQDSLLAECAEKCEGKLMQQTGAETPSPPKGRGCGSPDSAASILYTSGSTGRRKGVIQNQRNVLFHVRSLLDCYSIGPDDVHSLMAPFIFDASTTDLYCAVLSGALLVPIDVRTKGVAGTFDVLIGSQATIIHGTPTLVRNLCSASYGRRLTPVRLVIFGGESLFRSDLARVRSILRDECKVVNGYGATETSGFVALYETGKADLNSGSTIPVGRPPEGISISLRSTPGDSLKYGEVCVTSRHIALGYWRGKQNETGVFDTVSDPSGCRTYLTGDIGYWSDGGELVICGRVDRQVKIRGFRADLDEIEGVFLSYPGITHAIALPSEEGSKLKVVLSCDQGRIESIRELLDHLRKWLPRYLLPVDMFYIDSVPLTATGKADRAAVARLISSRLVPLEKVDPVVRAHLSMVTSVTDACERILGLERAYPADRFFEIGGDSVTMAQLHAEIEGQFKLNIPLARYYEFATLGDLAAFLDRRATGHVRSSCPRNAENSANSDIPV